MTAILLPHGFLLFYLFTFLPLKEAGEPETLCEMTPNKDKASRHDGRKACLCCPNLSTGKV